MPEISRPANDRFPALRAGGPIALLLLGAASVIPVMLIGAGLALLGWSEGTSPLARLRLAFFGTALPEEILRFALLYFVMRRAAAVPGPRDVFLIGCFAALGFSIAENAIYAAAFGPTLGASKLLIATPIHLALGIAMAAGIAISRRVSPEQRTAALALTLLAPFALHGLYDLSLLTALANAAQGATAVRVVMLPISCYATILLAAFCAFRRLRRVETVAAAA